MKASLLPIETRPAAVEIERAAPGFDNALQTAAVMQPKSSTPKKGAAVRSKPDAIDASGSEPRSPEDSETTAVSNDDAKAVEVEAKTDDSADAESVGPEDAVSHFEAELDEAVLAVGPPETQATDEPTKLRLPDTFNLEANAEATQTQAAADVTPTEATPAQTSPEVVLLAAVEASDVSVDTEASVTSDESTSGFVAATDASTFVTRSEASSGKGEEPSGDAVLPGAPEAAAAAAKAQGADFEVPMLEEAPTPTVQQSQLGEHSGAYDRNAAPSLRAAQVKLQPQIETTSLDFEAYESTIRMRSADKAELRLGSGDSKVTVVLRERGDRVFVSAQTATTELAKALEADASHLGQSLSQHGLDLGGFEASSQPEQPEGSEGDASDEAPSRTIEPTTQRRRIVA